MYLNLFSVVLNTSLYFCCKGVCIYTINFFENLVHYLLYICYAINFISYDVYVTVFCVNLRRT